MPNFLTSDDLSNRIAYEATQPDSNLMFLLGSGVALPTVKNGPGVPGSAEIVSMIKTRFADDPRFNDVVGYQEAFTKVMECYGADRVNEIVQSAVLRARKDHDEIIKSNILKNATQLEILEEEPDKWKIPPSLRALSALIAHFPTTVGRNVLTTNFDPLIEIALERQKIAWYSTALHADGSLLYLRGSGTHVVHLHGRWCGSDTLHTPGQLTGNRRQLEASLERMLHHSTIVVLGYGGWNDVVTKTLRQIIQSNTAGINVLWGFYSPDETQIHNENTALIQDLQPAALNGRVTCYKGIDANKVLVAAFKNAVEKTPAENLTTFLNCVWKQRTYQATYTDLTEPWGKRDLSMGYFMQEIYKLDKKAAVKAGLYALTYILPTIERQGVHQAPVDSPYYYIRKAMNLCLSLIDNHDPNNPEDKITTDWLSNKAIQMSSDSQKVTDLRDHLNFASEAIAATLAFISPVGNHRNSSGQKMSCQSLLARSFHGFCRTLHNDDGALWAYVSRRLTGGPDHLEYFNRNWKSY